MENQRRKHIRLQGYDYSQNGAYFITICSDQRAPIFGSVAANDAGLANPVGQGLCSCRLSAIGAIINTEIMQLPARYPNIKIDNYVIMPNHVHLLLSIDSEAQTERTRQEQSPCPTSSARPAIGDVICAFKSITTKTANQQDGVERRKIWQFRYHDHVVRGEAEYRRIWKYIDENPAKWADDCYYIIGADSN